MTFSVPSRGHRGIQDGSPRYQVRPRSSARAASGRLLLLARGDPGVEQISELFLVGVGQRRALGHAAIAHADGGAGALGLARAPSGAGTGVGRELRVGVRLGDVRRAHCVAAAPERDVARGALGLERSVDLAPIRERTARAAGAGAGASTRAAGAGAGAAGAGAGAAGAAGAAARAAGAGAARAGGRGRVVRASEGDEGDTGGEGKVQALHGV